MKKRFEYFRLRMDTVVTTRHPMEKFCDSFDATSEANKLGEDGWELISIMPSTLDTFETWIFKREIK